MGAPALGKMLHASKLDLTERYVKAAFRRRAWERDQFVGDLQVVANSTVSGLSRSVTPEGRNPTGRSAVAGLHAAGDRDHAPVVGFVESDDCRGSVVRTLNPVHRRELRPIAVYCSFWAGLPC